jgi:hypothetical protein
MCGGDRVTGRVVSLPRRLVLVGAG